MKELLEEFFKFKPAQQLTFLRSEAFAKLEKGQQIDFLKAISLEKGVSTKSIACALKILRELKVKDKNFFRIFLDHPDSSIVLAARRAVDSCHQRNNSDFYQMREMVKKQNRDKRIEAVKQIMAVKDLAVEDLLISFLGENDLKISELIINDLSSRETIDEEKLLQLLDRSVWYLKAAIIQILGNRRSESLFDKIDVLVNDPNAEVRLRLADALGKLSRDRVKKYLLQLSQDPHIQVKKEAQKILGQI